MTSAGNLPCLDFYFQEDYLLIDLTWPFKLSIKSNQAEHPKGLVPIVIRTTPFYSLVLKILALGLIIGLAISGVESIGGKVAVNLFD